MDHYKNNTTTAISITDAVQTEVEYEDFMEEFDGVILTLNNNLNVNVMQLVSAKKLKSEEIKNYIWSHKPTTIDVYKFLAADRTLTNCSNIISLLKISVLIPPSTSNVEHDFSVMNLICMLLWSTLTKWT